MIDSYQHKGLRKKLVKVIQEKGIKDNKGNYSDKLISLLEV